MKKTFEIFESSLQDIQLLLDFVNSPQGEMNKLIIFRSVVVLMVAAWEQFIEQLAQKSVSTLTNRIRDSRPLPEEVKQNVASYAVIENRSNLREFSNSVWSLSDKGWKKIYNEFCLDATTKLNTASSENIKLLYKKILGIRDITSNWSFEKLSTEDCVKKLDNLIELRHDIAHGKNNRNCELTFENIISWSGFLICIAELNYQFVSSQISRLSRIQAIIYNLNQKCFIQIIEYASHKEDGIISLEEIKNIGTSAQGNHNKLTFEPWGLLEKINAKNQRITERLVKFYQGEISLPQKVLKFDNNDVIPDPQSPFILFSDLS